MYWLITPSVFRQIFMYKLVYNSHLMYLLTVLSSIKGMLKKELNGLN